MEDRDGFPLAPDGYGQIGFFAGLALVCWVGFGFGSGGLAVAFGVLGGVASTLTVFLLNFFRDPPRRPPGGGSDLVSPADGKILIAEAGVEEKRFLGETATQISIFMSPVDVHVNRAPIDGRVESVHYHPGKYFAAFSEKASLDNEQNAIVMKTKGGRRLVFIQIAGFLARRIVCRVEAGDECRRGQRVGMIKLGSRVDIFVPGAFKLRVQPGDRVRAGETILGELG